jgi:lambda family phage tail tape measure protein
MAEFAVSGKLSFADLAKSIVKEMIKIAIIRTVLNLVGMFGGGGPSMMPNAAGDPGAMSSGALLADFKTTLPNANGNAFMGGNVIPFAKGGVFDSPQTFPMSGGNVGLLGEAGPEAIMPLRRGADGKLGVVAANGNEGGGNIIVNVGGVTINPSADTSPEQAEKFANQFNQVIEAKVVDTMRKHQRTNAGRGRMAG